MYTFDDFITSGSDGMDNYVKKSTLIKNFEYEIEKIYHRLTWADVESPECLHTSSVHLSEVEFEEL